MAAVSLAAELHSECHRAPSCGQAEFLAGGLLMVSRRVT
jgi:hypothetical protein